VTEALGAMATAGPAGTAPLTPSDVWVAVFTMGVASKSAMSTGMERAPGGIATVDFEKLGSLLLIPEADRLPPLDGSILKIFLPDVSSTVGSDDDVLAAPEFADFFMQPAEQANSTDKNNSLTSFDLHTCIINNHPNYELVNI
jgi:hypothetical protein